MAFWRLYSRLRRHWPKINAFLAIFCQFFKKLIIFHQNWRNFIKKQNFLSICTIYSKPKWLFTKIMKFHKKLWNFIKFLEILRKLIKKMDFRWHFGVYIVVLDDIGRKLMIFGSFFVKFHEISPKNKIFHRFAPYIVSPNDIVRKSWNFIKNHENSTKKVKNCDFWCHLGFV